MDGEKASESLWWRRLQSAHTSLLQRACAEGLIVCVPQTCSLTHTLIPKADFETHILRPTSVRGEFHTLTGRSVAINGCEIVTGSGFARQVAAKVLDVMDLPGPPAGPASPPATPERSPAAGSTSGGTATPPPPRPSAAEKKPTVRVYFLSRPLVGGIAAPSSVDELEHGAVLRMIAMLRSLPDSESIFSSLDTCVKRAHTDLQRAVAVAETATRGADAAKRVTDASRAADTAVRGVETTLRSTCTAAVAALLCTSMYEDEAPAQRATSRRHLAHVVTSYVMEPLHDVAMRALQASMREEVEAFGTALRSKKHMTQAEFGVKELFQCNVSPAVASFGLLHTAATPLEKLQCLRDVYSTLIRCVERSLEARGVDLSDVDMATDDVLDLLIWVLANGVDDHETNILPVHLEYINRFHVASTILPGEFEMSRLGFHFANVVQAVGYFRHQADADAHGDDAGGASGPHDGAAAAAAATSSAAV